MEIYEEAQEKFVKENEIEMEKLVESRKEEESQERKEELLKEARKRITEEMEEHRNYVNKIPEIFTKDLESLDDKNYIVFTVFYKYVITYFFKVGILKILTKRISQMMTEDLKKKYLVV